MARDPCTGVCSAVELSTARAVLHAMRRVLIRRRAGDHAARDRTADPDLLVTLPVPEVVAVDAARVAVAAAAALDAPGAEVPVAGSGATAVLHAVDVVPGSVAEGGEVGSPPATGERTTRTHVDPAVDRAAELRVPVGAETARTVGDVAVGRARRGCRSATRDRDRRTDHGRTHEETAATRLPFEETGRLAHQPVGERDALAVRRWLAHARTSRGFAHAATSRTAAMVFGSAVKARNTR